MLIAGSEMVRQIHDRQGKIDPMVKDRPQRAITFAQHRVTIAGRQKAQNQNGPGESDESPDGLMDDGGCPQTAQ